jgi:hypothetical protein
MLIKMTKMTYERLKDIGDFKSENPSNRTSLRVKILIKNLLEDW